MIATAAWVVCWCLRHWLTQWSLTWEDKPINKFHVFSVNEGSSGKCSALGVPYT